MKKMIIGIQYGRVKKKKREKKIYIEKPVERIVEKVVEVPVLQKDLDIAMTKKKLLLNFN
jgi:hypothetical protein